MLLSQGIAPMENHDWFQQLPLFVLVSMGGGLFGAAFNAAHKFMFKVGRGPQRHTPCLREAAAKAVG